MQTKKDGVWVDHCFGRSYFERHPNVTVENGVVKAASDEYRTWIRGGIQ
jgi:hypothetical protein